MNLDLTGKLALVTGSTRGIGLAAPTGLSQMGAEVIVNSREGAAVTEAMAKVRQSAPSAETHAVAVNSVVPGPTWVEMAPVRMAARAQAAGTTVEELKARMFSERRPASLLQRYATPEEVANLICYVCSKASSATNGAALRVDGGIVTNPF